MNVFADDGNEEMSVKYNGAQHAKNTKIRERKRESDSPSILLNICFRVASNLL